MQNRKKRQGKLKIIFCIMICVIVSAVTGCGARAYVSMSSVSGNRTIYDKSENVMEPVAPEEILAGGIKVSVDYGFNHHAKFGRYMNVRTNISASEQDFQGTFDIILTNQNGNHILYSEEAQVPSGSSNHITMDIPMNSSFSGFQYRLTDKKNKTIVEQEASVDYSANMQTAYIGILTDERSGFDYLRSDQSKAFYLDKAIITEDPRALDSLDIIVINQFNMNHLSEEQKSAVKKWTANGGTLVIGAGKNMESVCSEFLGEALTEYDNSSSSSEITFKFVKDGIYPEKSENIAVYNKDVVTRDISQYKTIEKDIYHVVISDAESVMIAEKTSSQNMLMQKKQMGSGNIQVFSFNLSLDKTEQDTAGNNLLQTIMDNFSQQKRQQLLNETSMNVYDGKVMNSLEFTSNGSLPKTGGYILVLFLYIIVVGPVLYIFLKKMDKRSFIWLFVPILAVSFAILVYFIGKDTRVTDPYAGYASFINVNEDKTAEVNTLFCITSPYNEPYEISFGSKYNVGVIADTYTYGGISYKSVPDDYNYSTAVIREGGKTTLKMQNYAAFTPVYFQEESEIQLKGKYQYDISDINNSISGTFTNDLGFDLFYTSIMCNGVLIQTGDIQTGSTLTIGNREQSDIITPDLSYIGKILDSAAGGKKNGSDMGAIRRHNLLESYIEKSISSQIKRNYLIGFVEDEKTNSMLDDLDLKQYGAKLIIIPLNVNQTKNGETYLTDLDPLIEVAEGYYDPIYRYISSEELVLNYNFRPGDKIKSIQYSERGNIEFHQKDIKQASFHGDVYFYNNLTEQYDWMFSDGQSANITSLADYLDSSNSIQVKVKTNKTNINQYGVTMPVLTAVKEAD